jgi:hypothetical protein
MSDNPNRILADTDGNQVSVVEVAGVHRLAVHMLTSELNAIHSDVAGEIAAITEKLLSSYADLLLIEDSADSNNKKRISVGNLLVSNTFQRVFTSTVIPGEPVYVDGAGSVDKAKADAAGTSMCLGIAPAAVTAASSGIVVTNGLVVLTTTQWDAVAGTTGGLTSGSKLFISAATAGRLTETAPTTGGQYVVEMGQALSTTEFQVRPRRRILLAA